MSKWGGENGRALSVDGHQPIRDVHKLKAIHGAFSQCVSTTAGTLFLFLESLSKNTCTLESLCKLDRRSHCTLLLLLPGERCVDTHSNVLLHWPASSLSCDGRNILQHMHHCDLCVHLSDEDIEVPPPRPKRKPHRLPSVLSTQFVTHMPAGRSSAGCGHCADHAWCSLTGGPWVLTLSTQSEYVSILPTLPCFHHADGEGRRMPRP